jgi:hypothetical protein
LARSIGSGISNSFATATETPLVGIIFTFASLTIYKRKDTMYYTPKRKENVTN